MKLLSKSKYLAGLQCPKLLWTQVNEPAEMPAPDAAKQFLSDEGHGIGELAHTLFRDGILVPQDDFSQNLKLSREYLSKRLPLFEAGFGPGRLYSRLDILVPSGHDGWDIVEVKGSTEVKDVNIHDVSFQRHCCREDGLEINKCFVAHVNNEYIRRGDINSAAFFTVEDVTDSVDEATYGLATRIDDMFETIDSKICPECAIGPNCSDPYDCDLIDSCWSFLPEHHVFELYYGGKKSHELFKSGVLSITEIPDGFKLNDKQKVQKACAECGKPHVNQEIISEFMAQLKFPLYYLDFETFKTAIPLYDGARPYQNIPFQYSLHVVKKPGAKPKHFSFLADGKKDPRHDFASSLRKHIGDEGSLVAYNSAFEMGILKQLMDFLPDEAEWIQPAIERFVDLLVPFRNFGYYHPSQHGSASLKKVLPALTGISYEGLGIGKGDEASLAYLELCSEDCDRSRRKQINDDLLSYCGLDTEGMIRIVDTLRNKCSRVNKTLTEP